MNYGGRFGAFLGALLVLVTGVAPHAVATGTTTREPVRIMLVGDSVTQGATGEYTWRYFLARHLAARAAGTDLVGPHRSVWVEGDPTWPAVYADPRFDTDHAGTWGDSLALPKHGRTALMARYRPDVVVLQLGINDLSWLGLPPAEVRDLVVEWVTSARETAPGTDFVLVQVGWPSNPRAVEFNALLAALPPSLGTTDSRVEVARVEAGFVGGTGEPGRAGDTYDPVHPNTSGQVKYAAAVADALGRLGVGDAYPRPLAVPPEGPRVRPALTGSAGDSDAQLTWTAPPGANNFDVLRRVGRGPWTPFLSQWHATSATVGGLRPCERNTFRVLARRGWTPAAPDMASDELSVTAGPTVRARPRVRLAVRQRRVVASWKGIPGACSYDVRVESSSPDRRRTQHVRRTSYVVGGLRRGATVRVAVRAVGAHDTTAYSRVVRVRVR